MKRQIFFPFIALCIISLLASCNPKMAPTGSNPSDSTSAQTVTPKNELIPFTEIYITSKKTPIKFSNDNMIALDFRNSLAVEITSDLFSENAKIVDGKAYIINTDLDKLKTIPTLSLWKAIEVSNIVRDASGGVKHISLLMVNEEKGIKYLFWFTRQPDNTFALNESQAGAISYNGKKYSATARGKAVALYALIEGLPPGTFGN